MREESIQTLLWAQFLRRLYQRALGIYRKFRLHVAESNRAGQGKSLALLRISWLVEYGVQA